MKINSISANTFHQANYSRTKGLYSNNQLSSDCFVKSKDISFCALTNDKKRQVNVDSFMQDLGKKINSPKFSITDISNSIHKYTKNINVRPMNQAPDEILFSKHLKGLYSAEMAIDESSKHLFIPKKNRNFYVRTETLKEPYGNMSVFVNAAHEFTHILQYEDSNASPLGLFNTYIDKNRNELDRALEQVKFASKTVNIIEEEIARPFISLLIENEDMAYNRMSSGRSDFVDWLCRKNKTSDFDNYVKEKVSSVITNSESEYGISADKKLIYEALINHFEREIEAYGSENRAQKMCLGIESPRALTRIDLYKKSINVVKTMQE